MKPEEGKSYHGVICLQGNMDQHPKAILISTYKSWGKKLKILDLPDIYRTSYMITEKHTFFSGAHGPFSRIDHMLGRKRNLSKFKMIEIMPCIFSDYNGMKLEINNRSKTRKCINTWKLNNTHLNSQRIKAKIKTKSTLRQMKMGT